MTLEEETTKTEEPNLKLKKKKKKKKSKAKSEKLEKESSSTTKVEQQDGKKTTEANNSDVEANLQDSNVTLEEQEQEEQEEGNLREGQCEDEKSDTLQKRITETMDTIRDVVVLSKSSRRDIWNAFSKHIKLPVACYGMILCMKQRLSTSVFFLNFSKSSPPPMFGLLEKISVRHTDLWPNVLSVYGRSIRSSSSLQSVVKISVCEFIMDRIIHLMMIGCVIPTLSFVVSLENKVDASVIAYFVQRVCVHLNSFSAEFVGHMCAILSIDGVVQSLRLSSGCRHTVLPSIVSMSATNHVSQSVSSQLNTIAHRLRSSKV
eukprot:m.174409 g.174409  ORF g.174409 m.174409 type:complete len:318 (+) comp13505_c9_seq6:622-1575(+)